MANLVGIMLSAASIATVLWVVAQWRAVADPGSGLAGYGGAVIVVFTAGMVALFVTVNLLLGIAMVAAVRAEQSGEIPKSLRLARLVGVVCAVYGWLALAQGGQALMIPIMYSRSLGAIPGQGSWELASVSSGLIMALWGLLTMALAIMLIRRR